MRLKINYEVGIGSERIHGVGVKFVPFQTPSSSVSLFSHPPL